MHSHFSRYTIYVDHETYLKRVAAQTKSQRAYTVSSLWGPASTDNLFMLHPWNRGSLFLVRWIIGPGAPHLRLDFSLVRFYFRGLADDKVGAYVAL